MAIRVEERHMGRCAAKVVRPPGSSVTAVSQSLKAQALSMNSGNMGPSAGARALQGLGPGKEDFAQELHWYHPEKL